MATKKYMSLERMVEYDALIKTKIDSGDESTLSSAKSYTDTEIKKIDDELTTVKYEFEAHTHSLTDIEEMEVSSESTVLFDGTITGENLNFTIHEYSNGYKAIVTLDGQEYESVVTFDSGLFKIIFGDYAIKETVAEGSTWIEGVTGTHNLKVEMVKETCVLPETAIPDAFATKEYVNNGLNTKADYGHGHSFNDISEIISETITGVFYEETVTSASSNPNLVLNNGEKIYLEKLSSAITISATINDVYYDCRCTVIGGSPNLIIGDYDFTISEQYVDGKKVTVLNPTNKGETYNIVIKATEYKYTIPEKYISGDIARTEYVDTAIDSITGGSVVVKEAEHAASATKATQDGNGKVIASTYETKTDASAKLIEAKTYTDTVAAGKSDSNHNHDDKYDAKGAASTALDEAKAYTDTMTSGIASTAVVDNKISAHNTSTSAHTDIRDLISELSTKVNNFLDVDDATTDQLSEVLTLINNNKGTLDSITSSKVNVSDIVDNLTTSSTTKVLSAKQGVALKALIDALQTAVDGKAAEDHGHAIADVTNLQSTLDAKAAQTALEGHIDDATKHITSVERANWNTAKTHADSAHAPSDAQENVIESIKVNGTAQTITSKTVNITVPTKASDIDAAATSHGTHVEYSTIAPVMDGTASAGSASTVARSDHKHPTDTSRASQVALDELAEVVDGKADSVHVHDVATSSANGFMSSTMFTKLNGIEDGATKVIVDTALNATSSNAIANSVVTSNINTLSQAIQTNAGGITTNANSIKALEESIVEITSGEIQALFAS